MSGACCGKEGMGGSSSRQDDGLVQLQLVERLSPRVLRVLGCNPGEYELQGTNTYLVGTGSKVILVDAGECGNWRYQRTLKNVLAEHGLSIQTIIITHHHRDHIGGAKGIFAKVMESDPFPLSKIRRRDGSDDDSMAPAGYEFVEDGHEFKVDGATLRQPDVDIVDLNVDARLLNPPLSVQPIVVGANPDVVSLDVIPKLLSPLILLNLIGVDLSPAVLDANIHPQILSPTFRARLINAEVQPQLLAENFQPEILSPEIFFDGANLGIRPRIVAQEIRPCLLGPKIHMALLKAVFAPDVAVSELSPALLCPTIFFQLLKAQYSPDVATHAWSPKSLSPNIELSLMEF